MNLIEAPKKIKNAIMGCSVGINCMLMTTVAAFAADPDLGAWADAAGVIEHTVRTFGNTLKKIATPIAIAAIMVCLIGIMTTSNQKQTETYKIWMKIILIAIVGIYAAPFLIDLAVNIGTDLSRNIK